MPSSDHSPLTTLPDSDGGRLEVAFVDTSIADYRALVAGLPPGMEIVLIDGGTSGLARMALWAEAHAGYDAIHIFSHGAAGMLSLGSDIVTAGALNNESTRQDLSRLGRALNANGDLLLYACSVAAGTVGKAFVSSLAAATGADVAASDDPTGSAFLGGNWVLEHKDQAIESTPIRIDNFSGTLADVTISNNSVPATHTSLGGHDIGQTFTATKTGVLKETASLAAMVTMAPTGRSKSIPAQGRGAPCSTRRPGRRSATP